MYYENKFGFYIKQYGIQITVGIICFIIAISGLFVYFKINNKAKAESTVAENAIENSVEANNETAVTEDDSFLPESLRNLKPGKKTTVKVATAENEGNLIIIADGQRINAKLAGVDYSKIMPDTFYKINQALEGKNVDITFDEAKVSNGYAMVFVYLDKDTLYNAKVLEEGNAILDSTLSKKSNEYVDLAESQAYAKQTLAGVWGI